MGGHFHVWEGVPPLENPTAVIIGPGVAVFENEAIASSPSAGEMLVQTYYTLISPGTELAIFQHTHVSFDDPENLFIKYPFRPGYAAVGRVLEIGDGVTGFAKGDWLFYKGRHQAYVMVKPASEVVLRLPDGCDPKLALFARLAQIAASASELSPAKKGGSVAVLGLGLVGNLAAQLFQQRGCDVLGVDLLAKRCEVAGDCGIRALQISPGEVVAQTREVFSGLGATTVVEASGHPAAVETALKMTARGGETILLGSTRGRVDLDVYKLIHSACITVRGSHESSLALFGGEGRPREITRKALGDIARGDLRVAPLLSESTGYSDLSSAYQLLCHQPESVLSIVLEWATDQG